MASDDLQHSRAELSPWNFPNRSGQAGRTGLLAVKQGLEHGPQFGDVEPVKEIHMMKTLSVALLLSALGSAAIASEAQSVQVTVKGILHQDTHGFFFQIDGTVYDIAVNNENKADMHKFYSGLEGDMVRVSGLLHVQAAKDGKPYMVVYTNDITRLKGERVRVVTRVETEERPVVREYYMERRGGIDLPFVNIHW